MLIDKGMYIPEKYKIVKGQVHYAAHFAFHQVSFAQKGFY